MPRFGSQYRYITGYYISLFLLALWMIPNIEQHKTLFRIVGGSIFFGGVGRLLSWIQLSWIQVGSSPPIAMLFTGVELLFPLLMVWQAKLPRQ